MRIALVGSRDVDPVVALLLRNDGRQHAVRVESTGTYVDGEPVHKPRVLVEPPMNRRDRRRAAAEGRRRG